MNLKEIFDNGICPSCNNNFTKDNFPFSETKICHQCKLKINYDCHYGGNRYHLYKDYNSGNYYLRWTASGPDYSIISENVITKIQKEFIIDFVLPLNLDEEKIKTIINFS